MKKFIFLFLLCLSACTNTVKKDYGLTKLNTEPSNCEFLYTISSNASVYTEIAAYEYLEQAIVSQDKNVDSYFVIKQSLQENEDAIFGPKNTYKLQAKVYKCNF
ncbi:MAG: hypothetical protein MJ158_01750 [Alphaproteobacteria bacterium]|nr:hypothetical protein [Alphaproteobacteria bacterium]